MAVASWFPPAHAVRLVHGFSSLCGALVAVLVFDVVRRIPFNRSSQRGPSAAVRWGEARLAGAALAALTTAVSMPMLIVSRYGDFYVLDVLLAIAAFAPAVAFRDDARLTRLYGSFALFGVGLAENPTMLLLSPFFALLWLWLLWRSHGLRPAIVFPAVALSLALLFAITLAYAYWRTAHDPAAVGLLQTWWAYERLFAAEAIHGVPKVGWLLLSVTNAMPLLILLLRPLDEPCGTYSRMGVYAFRLILLALGFVMAYEGLGAPSTYLGAQVLLVLPYVATGIWFGHLLGYLGGLLADRVRPWAGRLFFALALFALLGAGWLNLERFAPRAAAPVDAFAQAVVDAMDGRRYLITAGELDASIQLAARAAGRPLTLVNIRKDTRPLAKSFDNPRLRGAAVLGAQALLSEWVRQPASITGEVALLAAPALIPLPGYSARPEGVVYLIRRAGDPVDVQALWSAHRAAWSNPIPQDLDALPKNAVGAQALQTLARWRSRLANDLSALLDAAGHLPDARQANALALAAWPENLSALINRVEYARREEDTEEEARASEALKQAALKNPRALDPLNLLYQFGEVRTPLADFQASARLLQGGMRLSALSRADQVADAAAAAGGDALVELAHLNLKARRPDEAERLLRSVLKDQPDHQGALFGLFQLATHRRAFGEAETRLADLEAAGMEPSRVLYERGMLYFAAGRMPEARRELLALARTIDPPGDVWYALYEIARQDQDRALLDEAGRKLRMHERYAPGLVVLGNEALAARDQNEARRLYERALTIDPTHVPALIRLALMDYDARDVEGLRRRAAALLAVDPENAIGHFAAANVHLASGQLDLAEVAYRRSLASDPRNALAQNDLAWILNQRGQSEEATRWIRSALSIDRSNPIFWDTLAGILESHGKLTNAIVAIETALDLSKRNDTQLLETAEALYRKAGHDEKANDCAARRHAIEQSSKAAQK